MHGYGALAIEIFELPVTIEIGKVAEDTVADERLRRERTMNKCCAEFCEEGQVRG